MGSRPHTFVAVAEVEAPARVWSSQQYWIFNWFKHPLPTELGEPTSHLIVRARAGTGKTTTIIEGVNRAPESSILVCAFNKRIAEVLNSQITNPAAEAKTLHALGYRAIMRQWPRAQMAKGTSRADALTDGVCDKAVPREIRRLITKLHTKGREVLGGATLVTEDPLIALAEFHDLLPDEGWEAAGFDLEFVALHALAAMYAAATQPPGPEGFDFADMIYLPLAWNLLRPEYEMVVVDEAQDLDLAQFAMLQRLCSGRMCFVGDDKQAIYQWRGSASNMLDRVKQELGAAELPLTLSYRCSKQVLERARRLCSDIQGLPEAPDGLVDSSTYQGLLEGVRGGDFVLSRLNAPLVRITLTLLRNGVRARMAGRDVGGSIMALVNKLKARTIPELLTALSTWERKQVTRFASRGELDQVDRVHDQADVIFALAEDADDIQHVKDKCEHLFVDDGEADMVLASSVHKAKGLEAERVWLLQQSLYRRGDSQEERNIEYVAITRARVHLTIVEGVPNL